MKKMLSMLLCAALLLSCGVCAWAAEEEKGDHSHTVSDIYLVLNDQVIDMSGLTIEMDVTGEAGTKAGRLHIDQDGETVAEMGLTETEDGLYVLHVDSPTLGHQDYAVDPVAVLSRMMRSGIDGLVGLLQSIDPDSAAREIIDGLTKAKDRATQAPEAPAATEAPAETPRAAIPNISIEGDAMGLILGCIGEPETVHMGGMEYDPNGGVAEMPEGDYQVQTFTYDIDTVCQLLNMVYVDGQPAGLGDKVREAGVDFLFTGTFYDGEAASIGQVSGSISGDDFLYSVGCGYNRLLTEQGEKTTWSYGVSQGADLETLKGLSVSFTIADSVHEGEPFTADSVDRDQMIVLSDMEPEEALAELGQALGLLSADMLAPVLGPVLGALMESGDIDMSGLMEEMENAGEIPTA